MTEEEADALDELLTRTTPVLGPNGTGFFSRNKDHIVFLDDFSAGYIRSQADALHKTPAEIIGELVREKIAATA
ncbi:MAG: hypothetical protein LBN92_03810 [Treponema sp.]|jgi:hypothetical protein|nr:hypothetical protein [Treponema sp.]